MKKKVFKTWTKTKWPYCHGLPLVWAKTVKSGRGIIYLHDDEHFNFTASFGANSDDSYSGCFFGHDGMTLDLAKKRLDEKFA